MSSMRWGTSHAAGHKNLAITSCRVRSTQNGSPNLFQVTQGSNIMWHELQQMNAADGILTILKQTQREEIRTGATYAVSARGESAETHGLTAHGSLPPICQDQLPLLPGQSDCRPLAPEVDDGKGGCEGHG